eukprot:symbB.v1.2.011941.t1/scaffold814.1/size160240/11
MVLSTQRSEPRPFQVKAGEVVTLTAHISDDRDVLHFTLKRGPMAQSTAKRPKRDCDTHSLEIDFLPTWMFRCSRLPSYGSLAGEAKNPPMTVAAMRPSRKELHPHVRAELQEAGAVAALSDRQGEELVKRMTVEGQKAFQHWCKVWEPQSYSGFCGPASALAALRFFGLEDSWTQHRIYDEVVCPKQLFTRGISFANGVIMLKSLCAGRLEVLERSSFDEVEIAEQLLKDLADAFEQGEQICILVNYIRLGSGHWSPLAGWSNGHVLIMDTNQQRLPPYWVPLDTLVESLCRQRAFHCFTFRMAEKEVGVDLISLLGSPWTAKAIWILHHCGIPFHRRPFEPFADELWLRYKLGLWPWHLRFWSRFTVPVAIKKFKKLQILMDSFDIAEWAITTSETKPEVEELRQLRHWNTLSDVLLEYGRANFVKAATRDVRVAIEVIAPPWMKKLPSFLVTMVMKVAVKVFAFKYRHENSHSTSSAVVQAVQQIRAAIQGGKGKYLLGDKFSYADIVMAIAINGLSPSEDVFQFTVPRKYDPEAIDLLHDFPDVKDWKNAVMKQHLPPVLKKNPSEFQS